MIRFILFVIFIFQFSVAIVKAEGVPIGAARNFVWGEIEILEVVKTSRDFLASQPNIVQWKPESFSVFFEQEYIYVMLAQLTLGELPDDSSEGVSAFFELRRSDHKIVKFDLCSYECGIFRVKWFRQPTKIEFFMKGK
jgi:hypothetical protein